MKITKPDDVLLLQGYHARGGKPALMVTLAYVVDAGGSRLPEQEVWPWLFTHFTDETFDHAFKKDRGVFGVAGAAYAPNGQAVDAMQVQAQLGNLTKTLHVHGDRHWDKGMTGWQISRPKAFTSMPVTVSRAFGGDAFPENPHGQGYEGEAGPRQGLALPNIELPHDPIVSPADRPAVATFSMLPAGAPSRMRWVGRVDDAWERERFPWLPDDTDSRWFDGVPGDQAHDTYWQGDEAWSVQGMNADKVQVSGRLPGLRPRLLIRRVNDAGQPPAATEAVLDLDTVWLFPNEERVMVMYRAAIAVAREDAADIAGLGIFTETVHDAPLTVMEWDRHWQELDAEHLEIENLDTEIPPTEEQLQEQAEQEAEAQKLADELHQDIQASLDEGVREANQVIDGMEHDMRTMGDMNLPRISAPALLSLPGGQADDAFSGLDAAGFEAALKADIQASLDEGEALMEAKVRDMAQEMGLDADDLMEQVQMARTQDALPDDFSLVEHLAGMDLPDGVREEVLGKAQAFEDEMAAVDAQLDAMFPPVLPGTLPRGSLPDASGNVLAAAAGSLPDAAEPVASAVPTDELTRDEVLARIAAGQPLSDTILTDLDLAGIDFTAADFSRSVMTGCDFSGAVLNDAIFDQARVEGGVFSNATLPRSSWHGADLENTRFVGAVLTGARLTQASFQRCGFDQADCSHAVLDGSSFDASTFESTRFIHASLQATTLWSASATAADFSHGQLTGVRIGGASVFARVCFRHASLQDGSLQDSMFIDADFSEADLSDGFICGCDLSGSKGQQATARRADFKDTRFLDAYWVAANFMDASFDQAVLQNADLSGSNLHAAETRTATVRGLQVRGALLSRSRLLLDHAMKRGAS